MFLVEYLISEGEHKATEEEEGEKMKHIYVYRMIKIMILRLFPNKQKKRVICNQN